jgi:hypothetical protein
VWIDSRKDCQSERETEDEDEDERIESHKTPDKDGKMCKEEKAEK